MRKMIFAAVAAVALGTSSVAMAAHGGGGGGGGHMGGGFGGGHIGGGLGGHVGGSFGAGHIGGGQFGGVHPGGGLGLTPHVAGVPSSGGMTGVAPHTFSGLRSNPSVGRAYAFRGKDHGRDHFHHRRFGLGGLYAYGPSCTYSPYQTWPNYNNCDPDYYDQNYE